MAKFSRNILTPSYVAPTITSASGIWGMRELTQARFSGTWPSLGLSVDYLVVAGGGGGGHGYYGGGGGAGGMLTGLGLSLPYISYTITVGAGGNPATDISNKGSNGSNSVFSTITSIGGGGGGSRNNNAPGGAANGGIGGSGGGA